MTEQDDRALKEGLLCRKVPHTISGFFGCSGAMIATWAADAQLEPVVIGLCKFWYSY